MRKQQMYPFALEKWKKSTAGPQFCKSRHQACSSTLMLHKLCCFYFCNINWAQWRFWMGRIWGWNSCHRIFIRSYPNSIPLVINNHTISPFCHQMHKENCLICNSPVLSKFSLSKLHMLFTKAQCLFLWMNTITLQKCF